MNLQFVKDAVGWGFVLWLIGYALGILLFTIMPISMIGWIITPIGISITLWVLLKKVHGDSVSYYAIIGSAWLVIAVICDYYFLVQAFHPSDGYYKFDVYLYYALTLLLPVLVGWYKSRAHR